ncbi:MAG: alpha/beta fold hydrolase, partial [Gemmatimonadales bacterium]
MYGSDVNGNHAALGEPTPRSRPGVGPTAGIAAGGIGYQSAGAGDPLVFVHGLGLDSRMWERQFEHFAGRWRVVRYDLRGFGKSALHDAVSRRDNTADLIDLLDCLELSQVSLVGASFGGNVALDIVLRHPCRVKKLVLAGSGLHGYTHSPAYTALFSRVVYLLRKQDFDGAKQMWLKLPHFKSANSNTDIAMTLAGMVADCDFAQVLGNLTAPASHLASNVTLQSIRIPVLIVVGEHEVADLKAVARLLAANVTTSTLSVVKGVGHLPNLEADRAFNGLLRDFLADDEDVRTRAILW